MGLSKKYYYVSIMTALMAISQNCAKSGNLNGEIYNRKSLEAPVTPIAGPTTVVAPSEPVVITLSLPANKYGANPDGSQVHTPITVTASAPLQQLEISRDGYAPFYTASTGPYVFDWCVTCFNANEPLPRQTMIKARATGLDGRVVEATIAINVMSAVVGCSRTLALDSSSITPDSGFGYSLPIVTGGSADNSNISTQSTLRLLEYGIEIGPSHSLHADVRGLGAGRFSHWANVDNSGERIWFSTSDNSDPRNNQRVYTACVQ